MKIKFQYLSDIHLELLSQQDLSFLLHNIKNITNILILAGDIGNPFDELYEQFLAGVSKKFRKIFLISGNHEYYYHTIEETNVQIEKICKYYGISFLNNTSEYYNGFCFAGTTLWSFIENKNFITNDIVKIKDFNVEIYNELNRKSRHFLEEVIAENEDNIIVITHHVPSNKLVDKEYEDSPLLEWYYNDLGEMMDRGKGRVRCWVYGHTHKGRIDLLRGIKMMSNPLGYKYENRWFDLNRVNF